ncbi:MAG TPA: hypothetical protein VOA80_07550 [Thermoanaerobaculia bacterium]|nr:hypothetical protein [Thermoanaerobaculia bacterium]
MNRHTPLPPAVAEIFASILDRYSAVLPTLERNAPRLSDAEVEEISERVAEKLMTDFMQMAPSARARAKEKVKKLGYDIAVGIVSSGIFAALAYAASQIAFLDGASRRRSEEAAEEDRALSRFRNRLAAGIDAEEDREQLQSLNRELTHLSLSVRLVSEESKSLIASISRDPADPSLGNRDGFILRWFFADLLDALRDKAEERSLASGS